MIEIPERIAKPAGGEKGRPVPWFVVSSRVVVVLRGQSGNARRSIGKPGERSAAAPGSRPDGSWTRREFEPP